MLSIRTIGGDIAMLPVDEWYSLPDGVASLSGTAPLGFDGGDVNLYRFVGNDPIDLIDPSGLAAKVWGTDPWMNNLVGTEGRPVGTIDRIIGTPGWDGSHSRGAGNTSVPGHWDVWYEEKDTGVIRKQRYKGDGTPFTEEENQNVELSAFESEERRKSKRRTRRERSQSMNQRRRNQDDDEKMCSDTNKPGSSTPTVQPEDQTTAQPDDQQRRHIPEPTFDYPSWVSLYGDYVNPFYTPSASVDYGDTVLKWGKGASAVTAVVAGTSAAVLSGGGGFAGPIIPIIPRVTEKAAPAVLPFVARAARNVAAGITAYFFGGSDD